jgi:hypothetical protein
MSGLNHTDIRTISVDQLRVGLYVHLDLKWFEHPFAFSHFKIKSEEQIRVIRSLGLKTVRFSPELSAGSPAPQVATSPTPTSDAAALPTIGTEPELAPIMLAKRALIEQMRLRPPTPFASSRRICTASQLKPCSRRQNSLRKLPIQFSVRRNSRFM